LEVTLFFFLFVVQKNGMQVNGYSLCYCGFSVIKQIRHGFKAFINSIRLFCCLFILLNAKSDTEAALKHRGLGSKVSLIKAFQQHLTTATALLMQMFLYEWQSLQNFFFLS